MAWCHNFIGIQQWPDHFQVSVVNIQSEQSFRMHPEPQVDESDYASLIWFDLSLRRLEDFENHSSLSWRTYFHWLDNGNVSAIAMLAAQYKALLCFYRWRLIPAGRPWVWVDFSLETWSIWILLSSSYALGLPCIVSANTEVRRRLNLLV